MSNQKESASYKSHDGAESQSSHKRDFHEMQDPPKAMVYSFSNSGLAKPGQEEDEPVNDEATNVEILESLVKCCAKVNPQTTPYVLNRQLASIVVDYKDVLQNYDCLTKIAEEPKVLAAISRVLSFVITDKNMDYVETAVTLFNNLAACRFWTPSQKAAVFIQTNLKNIIRLVNDHAGNIRLQAIWSIDNICRDMGEYRDSLVTLGCIGKLAELVAELDTPSELWPMLSFALVHATSSPLAVTDHKHELLELASNLPRFFRTTCEEAVSNSDCKTSACEITVNLSRDADVDLLDQLFAAKMPSLLLGAVRDNYMNATGNFFSMGALSNLLATDKQHHLNIVSKLTDLFKVLKEQLLVASDVTEHGAVNLLTNLCAVRLTTVLSNDILRTAVDHYRDKLTEDNIYLCFVNAFCVAAPQQITQLLNKNYHRMIYPLLDSDCSSVKLNALSCLVSALEGLDDDDFGSVVVALDVNEWVGDLQCCRKHKDHEVNQMAERLVRILKV